MRYKKVAIIIPNYNKQKYLEECITSAINQTYNNLEIIIVDDCSTDDSAKIIRSFEKKHKNIKAFFLPTNHGVSYARNFGASKTNADYIVFLDSDDIYANQDKISNEIKLASENSIVFSQWIPMEENGEILQYKTYKHNPYHFFAISRILSICMPAYKQLRGYLIPKSLFEKVGGYNDSLNYLEDFDFQCRLCLNAKIQYTNSIGEAYRLNTGGLSKKSEKYTLSVIHNIQKTYYKQLNLPQKIFFLCKNKY